MLPMAELMEALFSKALLSSVDHNVKLKNPSGCQVCFL